MHSAASRAPEVSERRLWVRLRLIALSLLGFLAYPAAAWPRVSPVAFLFLATFAGAYVWVVWRNTPAPHRNRAPCALLLALAAGAAAVPFLGSDWLSGYGFFASVILMINFASRWHRAVWVGVPLLLMTVGLVGLRAEVYSMLTLFVLLIIVIGLQI